MRRATVPYWPRTETPRPDQFRKNFTPVGRRSVPTTMAWAPLVEVSGNVAPLTS